MHGGGDVAEGGKGLQQVGLLALEAVGWGVRVCGLVWQVGEVLTI